ncbi:MAG: hypothetical protein WCA78_12890 [Rhizomicrobium sp.]
MQLGERYVAHREHDRADHHERCEDGKKQRQTLKARLGAYYCEEMSGRRRQPPALSAIVDYDRQYGNQQNQTDTFQQRAAPNINGG